MMKSSFQSTRKILLTTASISVSVLSLTSGGFEATNANNDQEKTTSAPLEIKHTTDTQYKKDSYEFPRFGGVYVPTKFFKPEMSYIKDDLVFNFGGYLRNDGFFAKNPVMLNSHIPDAYEFYKQTLDMLLNAKWGKKTFGHEALEMFLDIRQKGIWGDTGATVATVAQNVKVSDSVVSNHRHVNNKPLLWIRDAWLKISLNALAGRDDTHLHTLKMGFFPFYLGRGIALGTIYGGNKEFLGIYTGYQNDQDAPGILLRGELVKDMFTYELYYSKLEEKGANLSSTFNHIKANHVGRSQNPWRGVGKDNDLIAAHVHWKYVDDVYGRLDIEPYAFYNEASDRRIEFEADAKSELVTLGVAAEYAYKKFEIGGEVAANLGREVVRSIDRNIIRVVRDDEGKLCEQYSHVCDGGGNNALVSKVNIPVVQGSALVSNPVNTNGNAIGNGLVNKDNRFRPDFIIKYRGWMGVIDAVYTNEANNFKVAGAFGYASGDRNPHLDEECDKTYNGWVGLQEAYAGKRVPSVFVLDARRLKRPLTLRPTDREAGDDPSFTDILFVGGGTTWFPREDNPDKFRINSNVLAFWKDQDSNKFDPTLNDGEGGVTDECASSFYGIEFNIRFKYEMMTDLMFTCDIAGFYPGDYYKDIKGTPLRGDVFQKLDLPDSTGVDSQRFRLGDDNAWLVNIGMMFKY